LWKPNALLYVICWSLSQNTTLVRKIIFANNFQLHATNVIKFFFNYIRQIANDIQLHTTYCTYNMFVLFIHSYSYKLHMQLNVQLNEIFFMTHVHFQINHLMRCGIWGPFWHLLFNLIKQISIVQYKVYKMLTHGTYVNK